ncbi:flagellar basal body rod C-terminal domain-containing protein [Caulobacter sp. DWR2-3-1b2]|uniref:flagellar basal body rod C-terminal domain-containing protein n=1 Tax=unclassified Caulobacter TaxID=2648921 RepID=UPI003CF17060
MQVLATAAAGMFAAADRLSASAQRTAASSLEGSKVDLAHEVVEQVSAKIDFKANAAVARTANEMAGALLDMKV